MRVLLGALVGAVVGAGTSRALAGILATPVFARSNARGVVLPTAAGLVPALAALAVAAAVAVAGAGGHLDGGVSEADRAALVAVLGFAWLGLIDDLVGSGEDGRGFPAHLRALARGRATTGALKLGGGAALALVVCAPISGAGALRLAADAALVALCANLGNQFDRAPGRTLKVSGLAFAVLVLATGAAPELAGGAVVVGAALALLPGDLDERFMLGDTGANALGAVLGVAAVVALGPTTRLVVLGVVAALNLAGEVVSFSRLIDAVGPLRAADRAGRRP